MSDCDGAFVAGFIVSLMFVLIIQTVVYTLDDPKNYNILDDKFECEQTTPTLIGEYQKDGTFEVYGESQKCTQYVLRLNHTAYEEVFG